MRITDAPPLPNPAPADLGYRMPAEWSEHEATWLTWPHCEDTWPGAVEAVVPAYVAMIEALRGGETVHVNVLSADHREQVAERLRQANIATGEGEAVRLHVQPTDDEWVRDYGALFVTRPATEHHPAARAATDWLFNSWGEKYDRIEKNNRLPERMAALHGDPLISCPIVMEGGSIDVNGRGALLTTESCLLNPNRNPGLSKAEVEAWLHAGLGTTDVLWLGDGIAGDDTDGHVDDMTRFVAPDTVVTTVEPDPTDDNHRPLKDNLERLRAARLTDGSPLRVIELPMPAPVEREGRRLPASYANFLIANRAVLLPVFNDPNDDVAAETLAHCFPDRTIARIPARDLVWGLGACHCLSQQVPRVPA